MGVTNLVLGGVSLLISAIRHYKECFGSPGGRSELRKESRECLDRLKVFEIQFDEVLNNVSCSVADSLSGLQVSNASAGSGRWNEIDDRVGQQLHPEVHKLYLDTMEKMLAIMADLAEELGVYKFGFLQYIHSSDGKSFSAKERIQQRFSYETQRRKFREGKDKRNELFDQLEKHNKSLERLFAMTKEMARQPQDSRHRDGMPSGFEDFWHHARDVHELLMNSWKCECHASHQANLRLVDRLMPEVNFDVSLVSNHSPSAETSWSFFCATISQIKRQAHDNLRCSHNNPSGNMSNVSSSSRPINIGSSGHAPLRSTSVEHRFQVARASTSFAQNTTYESLSHDTGSRWKGKAPAESDQSTMTLTIDPPRLIGPRSPNASRNALDGLCTAISKHTLTHPCTMTLAAAHVGSEYNLTPSPALASTIDYGAVNLSSLLMEPSTSPSRARRYQIAVRIASSHLQLHSSAWLRGRWHSDDVVFDSLGDIAQVTDPHLTTTFKERYHWKRSGAIDESFVTLGIILLELCFGKTLEQSPFRQDYRSPKGIQDLIMDLAAAHKWAELVEGEAGPEYAYAVMWCLGKRSLKSDDQSWRQELYNEVIVPLRNTYRKLTMWSHR